MKLKEIFTNPTFRKSIKFAEYLLLITTFICGFFWGMGFYYLGIPIGIVSAILVIANIYYERVEVVITTEFMEDDDNILSSDFADDVEDVFVSNDDESDEFLKKEDVTYRIIPEDCEKSQEQIPNGTFDVADCTEDSSDIADLEEKLSDAGKLLLNQWKENFQKYSEALEDDNYSESEILEMEHELDNLTEQIVHDKEEFARAKIEEAKRRKAEENKKRLEARKAKFGF